ncbi:hypothetical protein H7U32_04750 [Bifidobacterium pullorum subsp. saeculare]|uniref:Glycosyltransferase RgtA/B/C/D-like domain-containing protein n=1 Tax=Bifidobacterium pullorum subsp. saeculare TaxID=78257 RepID=A0A939B9L1_9BIFI|nr:hypothetical protein [Bifidobacterium pullorum]MBM6699633.1 hypothetical protein [Bifidobacterium pullorum subsp. saeculare]
MKHQSPTRHINHDILVPAIASVAICVMLLLIDSMSPLHPQGMQPGDQSIFQLIGWSWSEGLVPYRDIFDQKGPFIFFVNLLGWLLTGDAHGIFYIELPFAIATVILLWKIVCELFTNNQSLLRILTFAASLLWALFLSGTTWNMTENYCLPFLAASIWLIIRTINRTQAGQPIRIPLWEAIIHGLAFSVCFLTRVTNAIPTCIGVLILAILLIMRKQWKTLGVCIAGFLTGFLILAAPFAIYFAANNAFQDFLYGTILYNISYGAGGNILLWGFNLGNILPMFFIPAGLIIGGALLFTAKTARSFPLAAYALFCGLAFTVLFLRSNPYPHYAIPCVLLAPLAVAGFHRFFMKQVVTALLDVIAAFASAVFVVQYVVSSFTAAPFVTNPTEVRQLIQQSHGSIAFYNVTQAYTILPEYGITPYYTYTILPDWQASFSNDLKHKILEDYESKEGPEYLIVTRSGNITPVIQPILNERYTQVDAMNCGMWLIYQHNSH